MYVNLFTLTRKLPYLSYCTTRLSLLCRCNQLFIIFSTAQYLLKKSPFFDNSTVSFCMLEDHFHILENWSQFINGLLQSWHSTQLCVWLLLSQYQQQQESNRNHINMFCFQLLKLENAQHIFRFSCLPATPSKSEHTGWFF